MKKYLFIVLLVIFISKLKSDEIVIYSTESAQYSANDCCTLSIITNQNGDELDSKSCLNTANYGCMQSKSAPIWIFDLSQLNGNEDIQSIQFKGNLPIGGWFAVYFSVSSTVGQLSTTIASELWNGGHWSYGDGQYSGFSWPIGDFSQNLSLDIILPGIISGQLNILAYVSSWSSIDNLGDNAPRLVIEYEPESIPILGDINNDNIINVLDIIEIVNLILNSSDIYIEIADINFDRKINIYDLIHIIEFI